MLQPIDVIFDCSLLFGDRNFTKSSRFSESSLYHCSECTS